MQRLTAQEAMAHPYLKPIKVQREEAEAAAQKQAVQNPTADPSTQPVPQGTSGVEQKQAE